MSQLPLLNFGEPAAETNSPVKSGSLPLLNFGGDDSSQKLRSLLRTSPDATPEQAVQDVQLGRALNMPPDMVGMDRKAALDMKREKDISAALEGSDHTAAWMSATPWNLRAAQDDVRNLAGIEKALRGRGLEGAGISLAKTAARLPGVAGNAAWNTLGMGAALLDNTESLIAAGLDTVGIGRGQRTGIFGTARDFFLDRAKAIQKGWLENENLTLPEHLSGKLIDNPDYLASPEYLVYQAGEAANSIITMLAGGALAGGSRAAMATTGGLMEAGQFFQDLLDDGVRQENALSAAVTFGVGTGLLNKIGLDKMLGEKAGRTMAQAIADKARQALLPKSFAAGATEAFTEWAENPLQAVIEGITRGEDAADIFDRFVASLADVDVVPGAFLIGGGTRHVAGIAERKRARAFDDMIAKAQSAEQEVLANIDTYSRESKLAQRSPELFEDAVATLAQSTPVKNIHIPSSDLAAAYGEDAAGLDTALASLGVSREAFDSARDAGHDLIVPLEKYAGAIAANRELAAYVADNRRLSEDGFTNNELRAYMEQRRQDEEHALAELYQDNARVFERLATEKERLRGEAATAIRAVPGLLAQAESLAGGVDAYVDTWVDSVEKYALRMGATGRDPVEVFRRVTLDSLYAARRANMTPEQAIEEDLAGTVPAATDLRHLNVNTMDDVYALAEQTEGQFYSDVETWAGELGGEAVFRTDPETGQRVLKSRGRAADKQKEDYTGDASQVIDILGGTINFDTREQAEAAARHIKQQAEASGGTVIRDENRFENPTKDGYRDYQLNIRYPNGFATELLLNTRSMTEAKQGIGHKLYEITRKIDGFLKSGQATSEEEVLLKFAMKELRDASRSFYDAAASADSRNLMASASVISEPLNRISAYLPYLSGSSLYGEFAPLVETIRNSVPSLEYTNTLPRSRMNSSTNTGSLGPPFSHGVPTASRPSLKRAMNGLDDMEEPPSDIKNIRTDSENVKASGRIPGKKSVILSGGGKDAVRYEVRELSDVIPSHDPGNGFARRGDYPAIAQERPYHSDRGEQDKVRRNALEFEPAYLLNNNPDATNGPPIITKDGIVLGGNSRAMSLALVYEGNPEKAGQYRQALVNEAAVYGLDGDAVEGMKQPVLVRVVEAGLTPEEMAIKSRQYNQTTTQKLQAKAEGVSRAKMISPATLGILSADMADFDTLRQFLDSPASKKLVDSLLRDGVLEQNEISSLTEKGGRLNDRGKKLVEDALRGLIVPDYDILSAVPPAVLNKLDRSIPALARLKARGEGWDLSGAVSAALRLVGRASAAGLKVDSWLGQVDLMDADPDKKRPAVQALAVTFSGATQKEVFARFEIMAAEAERRTKGQTTLLARPDNKPAPAFVKAFLQPVAFVDGQTISGFDPKGNEQHEALQWAYDNGGKGHSVSIAVEKLHRTVTGKKATAEQKARAKEMIRRLSGYSGAVNLYPPKLGRYFSYRQGQELFQPAFHGGPYRFDRFSFDHIGKGKGNKSFGWGLYFSSNRNIADNYRDDLAFDGIGQLYEVEIPDDDVLLDWREKPSGEHLKMIADRAKKEGRENLIDALSGSGGDYYKGISRLLGSDRAASEFLNRAGIKGIRYPDPSVAAVTGKKIYNFVVFDDKAIEIIKTYYQGAERDPQYAEQQAKFDALQPIGVSVSEVKALRGGKDFTQRLIAWVKGKGLFGTYDNVDPRFTGVMFNAASVRSVKRHYAGDGKIAVLQAVPELIRNGVYLETTPRNNNGLQSHIFAGRINLDGTEYAVGFVIREDRNGRRYFDHSLTDVSEMTTGLDTEATKPSRPSRGEPVRDTAYEDVSTIVRKHLGVNPDLTLNSGNRGSVSIYPETYLINLFKGADLSTLLHETGHIFFEEMERMVRAGAADETMRRDYETMRAWLGATPGETLTTEQRERAARGFEAYLMEGRAPSVELEGAFARFKRWLLKIYQSAANLNVELTDEVRGVFDRMLSTEREIAAAAARNELLDLTAGELDALGLTGTARATASGLMAKGREAASVALQKARDASRKARLNKFTREARDEVREMPVYKARSDMRRTPLDLDAVKENFGEDAAKALMKGLPGALKQDSGVDPEIFAAEHGFASGADMITRMLAAGRRGDAVADIVRQKEARHDAAYDAFESLMETREVAVQMEIVGRKLADLLGAAHIERDAYVRAAERELAAMPLGRAVQTGNFLAAMRRALRQERTALNAGDRQAALDAHRKAMLNMEFTRLSRDLARRRDSTEARVKRFIGMAKGDPDARFIVMDIGMRHGLNQYSDRLGEGRDTRAIQSWLKGAEADGYTVFADDSILYGPGKPWREMSVTDFEALNVTAHRV